MVLGVWQKKDVMLNARVIFKSGGQVHVERITSVGSNMVDVQWGAEEGVPWQVLERDRNL